MPVLEYDLRRISEILDEVIDMVKSERLLSARVLENSREFSIGGSTYSWRVENCASYIKSIDVDNEDTPYLVLENDIMSPVQTSYHGIHSYGLSEITDIVRERKRVVTDFVDQSEKVLKLADNLFKVDQGTDDPKILINHVRTTISRQLAALMESRALTSSKRYTPLEILFDAYEAGLYPYGWDWDTESILCIRPQFT